MKWTNHGANPENLYKQFDIKMPEDVVDFSTNTNVIEIKDGLSIDISDAIMDYPDDASKELTKKLAEINSVSEENILVTNGSNEAIYILASLYDKIAVLQPTYSEYERACAAYGKTVYSVFSADEIKEGTDLFIICNPNNPTGKYLDYSQMQMISERCKSLGTDLLIDEAYRNFILTKKDSFDVKYNSHVYILRSMTKIYKMAGARLGYVIADKEKILTLKRRQPTWSVNTLAQQIGNCYLKNKEYLKITEDYYKKETQRFISEINKAGFETVPSDTHFFLMKVEDDEKLIRFMLKKGLVLRHTRDFMGLDGKYVRICTRRKEENIRLIDALLEYGELHE